MEKNWYVIHTYSGYENKVKANLEKRVETMGMEDKIFQVLVPEDEETEIKDGKKKTSMKKFFPGYVLTEMIMTDDSWYVVRNTPGVTGFVGSSGQGAKPIPLLPDEVDAILSRMGVEEKSDGSMTIDLFPQGQLGDEGTLFQQAQSGTLDILVFGQSAVTNTIKELAVFDLPYLFDSVEQVNEVLSGDIAFL